MRQHGITERLITSDALRQAGYTPRQAFKLANHPRHTLESIQGLIDRKEGKHA